MNPVLTLAYRFLPSFKREGGGLYTAFTAVYSRCYAIRMRYLHRRGRHPAAKVQGISRRCQWCGATYEPAGMRQVLMCSNGEGEAYVPLAREIDRHMRRARRGGDAA
ncbi:hypothetical protein [Streptomyces halstedii]|uniref:hypothetical protein n=1 Tax=Streptomyces halstedii TaxID=1944 RepID=UPI003460732C